MLTLVQTPISFATEGSEDASAGVVITGFVPLEQSSFYFEGNPTEEELTASMPETLDVFLDGSDVSQPIGVSWETVEDYDNTCFYFYSLRPIWSGDYVLSSALNPQTDVPWITVFRQPSQEDVKAGEQDVEIPVEDPQDVQAVYTEDEGPVDPEQGDSVSLIDVLGIMTDEAYAGSESSETRIYRYLTEKCGLNMAAACGVMTNIYAESGMKSNNLENVYNARFGLSDSEYTKRVNKGIHNNGKYKTRSGSTRYFTKDYCGYGICQWTSLHRRKNLLKMAVKKDVSISNLNMQMAFLKKELKESYPQVWATLKGVPNNATGVYLAAEEFCIAFEAPANTYTTAASRARTALSTFWKNYSGKSAKAKGTSYLGVCGYTYPKSLKKGDGITCSGYLISNYTIRTASAKIIDSSGKVLYKKVKSPRNTVYSLMSFDSAMLFSKLKPGKYVYRIYAKDSSGKVLKVRRHFTVARNGQTEILRGCAAANTKAVAKPDPNAPSKLRGSGITYPTTLKKGKTFDVKGEVLSNFGLKKVRILIKKKDGTTVISAKASPAGTYCYDLKHLDEKVKFGTLARGTYNYIVKATDAKKSKTLLNKEFTVK